jgi:hypothetical protein
VAGGGELRREVPADRAGAVYADLQAGAPIRLDAGFAFRIDL